MAIIKITELPAATSPVSPSDVAPVVQDGVTKKTAIDQFGFVQSGTTAVTRTIQNKLRETVSVKDFGAAGDGVTDDTAAIQAAVNFSKANKIFNNGNNSTPRGGVTIYFPPGLYVVAGTINLNNINGINIVGDGKETSMLVHTANSGAMFSMNQMIRTTFESLGFAAGTVTTNDIGNLTINQRASGSRTTDLFDWVTDAGGDRYNSWVNIHVRGGFAKVWDVGGTTTHSENSIINSEFFDSDYVWYSNNVQSINTSFVNCTMEFIDESCFYYIAGGQLSVLGGSYINPKDTLTLAGNNTQIGTSNGQFTFRSVKWEMFQNIDPTSNPYLLRSTSTANFSVSFEDCSNNAGSPDAGKDFISVVSSGLLSIYCCDFVGVIQTTPTTDTLGFLSLKNCRRLPSVVRNASGSNTKYKVFYDTCYASTSGPMLNRADVDDNNERVISYNTNAVRLRIRTTISSAQTRSLSFSVPSNMIFNRATVTVGKAGGVQLDVNVYMDAGKTIQLFTVNTGTSVTPRIWTPSIAYSGDDIADYVSGGTIYVDVVSAGNAGLVDGVITLEYVSNG